MTIETNKQGKVSNGQLSKTIDGQQYPTPEAVALLVEAFGIQNATSYDERIGADARRHLAKRYGVSKWMMILSDTKLGNRINDNTLVSVNTMARTMAFMIHMNK